MLWLRRVFSVHSSMYVLTYTHRGSASTRAAPLAAQTPSAAADDDRDEPLGDRRLLETRLAINLTRAGPSDGPSSRNSLTSSWVMGWIRLIVGSRRIKDPFGKPRSRRRWRGTPSRPSWSSSGGCRHEARCKLTALRHERHTWSPHLYWRRRSAAMERWRWRQPPIKRLLRRRSSSLQRQVRNMYAQPHPS